MKKTLITWICLVIVLAVQAQMVDPVHFKVELKTGNGAEAEIVFHATIDQGWHVYSTEIGEDGPIEATFSVLQNGKADATRTAGKTVDHLPCKAVVGSARHAAVGTDAQLRPTAKSRMDHAVVTDELEYVIIQYGREHGGKNQRYRSEFPYVSLAV